MRAQWLVALARARNMNSAVPIYDCFITMLCFLIIFHVLLCAKKKKASSENDAVKKNQNQNQEGTTTAAGVDKNAGLGADDPDLVSRAPPPLPEEAEADLRSDRRVSSNRQTDAANVTFTTPTTLASAIPSFENKQLDKKEQNSAASTVLLSISKQLAANQGAAKKEDHTQAYYCSQKNEPMPRRKTFREIEQTQKSEQSEQTQMPELPKDKEKASKDGGIEKVELAIEVDKRKLVEKAGYRKTVESSNRCAPSSDRTQGEKSDQVVRSTHLKCFIKSVVVQNAKWLSVRATSYSF
ncbi:unnamed protein product [Toxocara canis]|uniref:Uncharacterized protein n=1 Tax=Toxocara canis TaxID=6265 RepID=A0A183VDD2_TOXCA|nr:unnamed protein product [Toxocara canis]